MYFECTKGSLTAPYDGLKECSKQTVFQGLVQARFLTFYCLKSCHDMSWRNLQKKCWPGSHLARLPSVTLKVSGSLLWNPSPLPHSFSSSFKSPNLINPVGRGKRVRGRSTWCNLRSGKVRRQHRGACGSWWLCGGCRGATRNRALRGVKIHRVRVRPSRRCTRHARLSSPHVRRLLNGGFSFCCRPPAPGREEEEGEARSQPHRWGKSVPAFLGFPVRYRLMVWEEAKGAGWSGVECVWIVWGHVTVWNPCWIDSEPADNHRLISLLADSARITRVCVSVSGCIWDMLALRVSGYVSEKHAKKGFDCHDWLQEGNLVQICFCHRHGAVCAVACQAEVCRQGGVDIASFVACYVLPG